MTHKRDAVFYAGAAFACAAVLLGCPWSGLDYLVEGPGRDVRGGATSDSGALDSGGGPARFETLPVHAQLPSEGDCTAWVMAHPTPENIAANAPANQTVPTTDWLSAFHDTPQSNCPSTTWCDDFRGVSGNFRATTDMVLRWAACKWGIDEDWMRALAMQKSSWNQSTEAGSVTTCTSQNVPPSAANYWSEPSPCKPSKGIFQVTLMFVNASPYALTSTALNADVTTAELRSCMNGGASFLTTTTNTAFGPYPPTDTDLAFWGCIGFTHSGEWGDAKAVAHVDDIKTRVTNRTWPH